MLQSIKCYKVVNVMKYYIFQSNTCFQVKNIISVKCKSRTVHGTLVLPSSVLGVFLFIFNSLVKHNNAVSHCRLHLAVWVALTGDQAVLILETKIMMLKTE